MRHAFSGFGGLVLALGAAVACLTGCDASAEKAVSESGAGPDDFRSIKAKAEKGDAEAQATLGQRYAKGDGVEKDYAEALKWFRRSAEQGHPKGQYSLGITYSDGNGVETNFVEALKWYRLAADQNYARAQCAIGYCYAAGEGVAPDRGEALKWWLRAAEQNDPGAQVNLGASYESGNGVPENHAEAVKWYRKAADQNDADGQAYLGTCYGSGKGVKMDMVEAVKWWIRAADQGNGHAQGNLGVYYYNTANFEEALKWLRKGAMQNLAGAQFPLGMCYATGRGTAKDLAQAYMWFDLAAALGHPTAAAERSRVESQMTPAEIAEAQRLVRDFRAGKPPQQGTGQQQQQPADPSLTLMEGARQMADTEFFKHWRMIGDKVYAFTAANGTTFEAAEMLAEPYNFPIQYADQLNGIELKIRFIYKPRAFRYTTRGRTTEWISGDAAQVLFNPLAAKPPMTTIFVQKRNGQWTTQVTLPNETEEASEKLRSLQDMLKDGSIPGVTPPPGPPSP